MNHDNLRFYCSPDGLSCRWMSEARKHHESPEWIDVTSLPDEDFADWLYSRQAASVLTGIADKHA